MGGIESEKKNILFIGANNMCEIERYVHKYQNGLFIEAIPAVFKQLEKNLQSANIKHKTNYKAINSLVSDEIGKEYTFHIFNNNGASSSIYSKNDSQWKWSDVKEVDTLQLKSTTIKCLLQEQQWEDKKYDLVLDVQGAELDVLKGFSKHNLQNIENIQTEISTKEFYNGGVLFTDLNNFIISCGFNLVEPATSDHCDVYYSRV